MKFQLSTALLGSALTWAGVSMAADNLATWMGKDSFKAFHVYAAEDGTSKVVEIDLPVKTRPGGKFAILDREIKDINLGYYEDGWFADMHYANMKRLNIVFQGDFIFDVGDGREYRVKAGEAILAEDYKGKGHSSRCAAANGKRCISMSIALGVHDGKPTELTK